MKPETFITRLARDTVVSTMVSVVAGAEGHSAVAALPPANNAIECAPTVFVCSETFGHGPVVDVITVPEDVREWTETNEKEFRHLALAEAKGELTPERAARLETLSSLRDRQFSWRPTEEVIQELKRNRVLSKMAESLNEYVHLLQVTGDQGTRSA